MRDEYFDNHRKKRCGEGGLTLIETLIGSALFGIIATAIYFSFANILDITTNTKLIESATGAIQSRIEVIRNMPYQDIGIDGGWPAGKLPVATTTVYDGTPFQLSFTVRNIDDPFDGTLGGTPNDTAPADYKLIEIVAGCPLCKHFIPVILTARVAPKGLENASTNGTLFVNVFDADGSPVSGANVMVTNGSTTPTIFINDTTNMNGVLQLVDIPTSTSNYQIFVSKTGFSSDKTYPPGTVANPTPIRPHATVAQAQVTQVSFAIDALSAMLIQSADEFCAPVSNVAFTEVGTKLIGTSPDVLKYSTSSTTGGGGIVTRNLEWDTYTFTPSNAVYDLAGYTSPLVLALDPAQSYTTHWTVVPKSSSALLISVSDASSSLPLGSATTTLTKTGFSSSATTGRRTVIQNTWSGSGNSGFDSLSTGVDTSGGELKLLVNASGTYTTGIEEWLISNTFDFGTSTTSFFMIETNPQNQPTSTGADSLRFQVAANNDGATWNFVGPDGTSGTYFSSDDSLAYFNGRRYMRYKVFLKTADETVAPSLDSVTITFGSNCFPGSQAFFSGLSSGSYTLTIERSGYQTTSTLISIGSGWQEQKIFLSP